MERIILSPFEFSLRSRDLKILQTITQPTRLCQGLLFEKSGFEFKMEIISVGQSCALLGFF